MKIGLVGSDLEYAVFQNGRYKPAGILPIVGTKGDPEVLKNGGVEIDCCAVEITPPPAKDEDTFVSNILNLLNEVKNKYSSVQLRTTASWRFSPKLLKTVPYANVMGCMPDFCAWTGEQNPRPKGKKGLRSFGGHIHIENGTVDTIKACDLTLGMWSVLVDKDNQRRKLYGKAGAFRMKPYGVEYRVLSNFWCGDEANIRTAFRLTRMAQEIEADVPALVEQFGGADYIQRIINDAWKANAAEVAAYFGIKVAA